MAEDGERQDGAEAMQVIASAYGRVLFDYFVQRRGRGTDLSSQDVQLLLRWEEEGVPEQWVVEGIDAAFAKLREAPSSISECRRHVLKVVEKRREVDAPTEPAAEPPATSREEEPAPIRALRALTGHERPEVASAASELLEAVLAEPEEARHAFELLGGLDGRLEAAVLARLPEADREAVRAEAAQMLRRERRAPDAAAARRAQTRAYRSYLGIPPLS